MKNFYILKLTINKVKLLLLLALFLTYNVQAQTVEHFSNEADNATTFSEGGLSFSIGGSYLHVEYYSGYGYTGSSIDDYYVDNSDHLMASAGVIGSFTTSGSAFSVHELYLLPSEDGAIQSNSGTVIIRGKLNSTTKFTHTVQSSDINLSSSNNYYTYVDLSAYSTYSIDELEFETTGVIKYIAIDAFKFSVAASAPTVTSAAASSVGTTTATLGGNVTSDGGASVTERGVVYSTTDATPTIAEGATKNSNGSGTGTFSEAIGSLSPNTTYYYNSYAINSEGTSYGTSSSFTTLPIAATVTTQAVSSISTTTATGNGNITDLGNPNPTAYGVCWNTSGTPTTAYNKTNEGAASATGAFISSISGLSPNTTYYVRAYATNTAGTTYGSQVSFKTLQAAPTVTTNNASAINSTDATLYGTVNANNLSTTVSFEYGLTTSYGATVTADQSPITGSSNTVVSKKITDLLPNTTYHYRVVGTNSQGTTNGSDKTFTTANILELVFTLSTPGTEIQLPLYGSVNCTVDWNDGSSDSYATSGDKSHTFASSGTYTVKISGTLSQFGNGAADWTGAEYLVKVNSFGNIGLTSLSGAFRKATSLTTLPINLPSSITDLSYLFEYGNSATYTNISGWDVSNVTNMSYMFVGNTLFNQSLSSWNTSSLTSIVNIFAGASSFNQPLNNWDVSNVTNLSGVFNGASSFNQPLNNWNTAKVTSLQYTFRNATSFDQDISNWNIEKVNNMTGMLTSVPLSPDNYSSILVSWATQNVTSGITLDAGSCKYLASASGSRQSLIDNYGWTINDAGSTQTIWDGTSWSNGSPTGQSDIVLTGNLNTTGNIDCHDFTISPNTNLTANHTINISGNLILESNSTGSASIIGNQNINVTGNTKVQSYLKDYGAKGLSWHYITIPVDVSGGTVTSSVFGTPYNNSGTDYYALYYNETIPDYVGITDNSTVLSEQMRGYAVPKSSAETLEFTGDLLDGTQSINLTKNNTGFNLLGNPYPSGLNLGNIDAGLTGITTSNLATTVWVRENGGFNEYNWQSGTSVTGTFAGVLPPMQAAWFKVSDGQSSGTLQFDNTARIQNNQIIYKSTQNNVLNFNLSDEQNVDYAAVGLYENATQKFDNYDSEKMFDQNENVPQVYMQINDKKIAINGVNNLIDDLNIPIGIKTSKDEFLTISFDNISKFDLDYDVFLKDNLTNELINIRNKNKYKFYTEAINSTSRLSLIIKKSATDIQTIVNNVNIYSIDKCVIINSQKFGHAIITVYDIYGRTVISNSLNLNTGINKIDLNQEVGIYIVNIRTENYNSTKRVIIK